MLEQLSNITTKKQAEEVVEERSPLDLDIDDNKLVKSIKQRVKSAEGFYKKRDLKERQERNFEYVVGKQINEDELKSYQARYMDNAIFEAVTTTKPIALSKLPDLIVKPGNDTEESKTTAEELSDIINSEIRIRENRQVLGVAFKHRPIYFLGAIKYRWNPEIGEHGDYVFEIVHPDRLILDHRAQFGRAKEMEFIGEYLELSVKEVIMRFPDKENDLLEELGVAKDEKHKVMDNKIKILEFWFTDYVKKKGEYKKVEAVAWKYKNLILKKMKNPNFDHEGEERLFSYEEEVDEEQIRQSLLEGRPIEGLRTEQIFHNYFREPEKPYIFLTYHQFGTMPYDETSEIEQVIYTQDNINKRGRQITEMADRAKGKHVFSKKSGLKAEDIEEMDLDDPDEDVLIDGDLRDVHAFIPSPQPDKAMFNEQEINRNRLFSVMKTHSTTRGEHETDTATTSQILREADFGVIDDITEETINYAAEQMARAALQMIKLRYTKEHIRKRVGEEGDVVFNAIHRDMVEDGMEVEVFASSVDKTMRQRRALELGNMQMTDPISFFEDLGLSQPEERAEKLILFQTSPEQYMAKFVQGLENTQQMAEALTGGQGGQAGGQQGQPGPSIEQDLQMLQQGQIPQVPQQITPEYVKALSDFIKSPQFAQLPPEVQQAVKEFAKQVVTQAKGARQAQQAQPQA